MPSQVLVTGGSGFVAGHVILQLLRAGHSVRATVRSREKEAGVRKTLANAGANTERLTFAIADLLSDDGWAEACASCDFVQHVASPLLASKNPDDLIRPAVDG